MDDLDALELAKGVVERVMAKTHPGRPAFYALGHARREIEQARLDIRLRTIGLEPELLPRA